MATSEQAQAAVLRALLTSDPAFEGLSWRLAGDGDLAGYGDLVWSAFSIAVRRRLGSTPAPGNIVRLAAALRVSLRRQQVELDPLAVEDAIRAAAGGQAADSYDAQTRAEVLLFALGQLISDERMDDEAVEDFLVLARGMAARRRLDQEARPGGEH